MAMTQEQAQRFAKRSFDSAQAISTGNTVPEYSPWRHGGYYVDNLLYPSGAVGCVARYKGGKEWQIACDPRRNPPTFRSRDEAARAEAALILTDALKQPITIGVHVYRGMVESIRASHPEITAFVVDMDTATQETETLAAQFDALPHEIA